MTGVEDEEYGVFRVLLRTDRRFIVYDPRLPPGKRTLRVFRKRAEAERAASTWHRLGHG